MSHFTRKSIFASLAFVGMLSASVLPGVVHAAPPVPYTVNPMTFCGGVGSHDLGHGDIHMNGNLIGRAYRRACNGSTSPQWVTVQSFIGVVNIIDGGLTTQYGQDTGGCYQRQSDNCTTNSITVDGSTGSASGGAWMNVNGTTYFVDSPGSF